VTVAVVLVVVVVMVAVVTTDLQAHARDRQEHADLAAAQSKLSASRSAIAATSYDKALTTNHRSALQASVAATLARLATADNALSDDDAAMLSEGGSTQSLEDCLGGVQSAYQQIAAHNNTLAAEDISASSTACTPLVGGTSGGLVYPFDFPDPDVILVGGTYFAYGTNSVAGNIQIIESTNLTTWSVVGDALPNFPSWAAPDATWAPAVAQIGGDFVLYYAAEVAGPGGGEECISVATAGQPQGPFVDNSSSPLECQPALGGSLDPSPFIDTDGKVYLEWKSNGGTGPATIWSEQLDPAGTGFAANVAPVQLLQPDQGWESGVVEAPDLVTSGGRYFLFYSGNNWEGADYAVGVATCTGPLGPCAKPLSQPILTSGSAMEGPGGESVFADASGSYWVAFAAWIPGAVGYPHSRDLFLRRLDLSGPTPVLQPAG
jgi:Glycosyl hydrolases family 43